ncbi:MAG: dihydrofolate reductase family protein [Parvularculaceae bacterium]
MSARRLVIYIAASLDGYIADADGGVGWLHDYHSKEIDFSAFDATIDTFVMGRKTFEKALTYGPWKYSARRAIVVTNRPLENPPENVEAYDGDIGALAASLREEGGRNVWIMGGGEIVRAFLNAEAWDEMNLFIMPVVLGDGIRLFPNPSERRALTLTSAQSFANGVVRLDYEKANPAAEQSR